MSEPIEIKTGIVNVIVSTDGITDATGLRELADWIDSHDGEFIVHQISNRSSVHHGGRQLIEESILSMLVEPL